MCAKNDSAHVYHLQGSCGKSVSRILSTGGHAWQGACMAGRMCMVGGMHGSGCAWCGACMAGGVHGRLAGMCGGGDMHGGGYMWQGVCMVGGMHGRGACMAWGGMHGIKKWQLQQAVHILLECILVSSKFRLLNTIDPSRHKNTNLLNAVLNLSMIAGPKWPSNNHPKDV